MHFQPWFVTSSWLFLKINNYFWKMKNQLELYHTPPPKIFIKNYFKMVEGHICGLMQDMTGFPQTFDKWIQGLFEDFQGQQ